MAGVESVHARARFNKLQFFVVLVIFNFVYGWFHEFGHVFIGILGGGVIKEVGFGVGGFWVVWSVRPVGWLGFLMPFSGGMFAGVAALVIVWAADSDPDVQIANYFLGLNQLMYGFLEGLLYNLNLYKFFQPVGIVAILASTILAVFTAKKI